MIQKPCELLVGTNPGSPRSIAVLLPLPAFFEGARLLFTSHLYPLLFLIQLTATLDDLESEVGGGKMAKGQKNPL